ncbi:probable RNA-directed DNA polymerase from transposon X-element [Trichonephila clavipes]|nr:probable RNA-directed DNA polymerase from transposon X-element [Trichonephila clavipes]
MFELKRALSSAHNTSPGPDGISYVLLRHLSADSLVSLLYLFNRIWREQVYPTQWQEAIVIPILKPGKDPKNPLSYRPIALTSCLCKTLERMVNARFVYELEKNKCIPLFQSGFRKGRSTLDNITQLESKIRNTFVRRNHLVSIFFDIEKAYDRTWRYGILRTLFDFGFRGNLPTFIQHFLKLRTFRVRLGGTLSAPFTQAEGVPQGSILSVTLFICHISSILNILSPSIQASLYVDDLQISCEGSDMRMIERQLQTAVNNILKWCDTNGHSISASKSCCVHFCRKRGIHPDPEIRIRDIQIPVVPDVRFLGVIFDRRLTFLPHILHLRKKCEKSLNLLKVLSNTSWGADRTSLLRVYQAIVLSRIDYGCVAYGSACNSTLQKLDPVHHMALRICSGAFRTSPVQSLYVNCHQLPLDLRRRKLSLAFYFKILSVPSHPLQNVYMSTSMKRLYDARPSNIRPFMDRMKLHISELDLPNVPPVVFQRVFAYHRSQYSHYSAIYTDGSKRADYVGCGVVIEDIMHGYRLDTSCSIFTAEAVAIYRALQLIDSTMPRKYCIYTDSMSVLEALENYHDRCHPVVCTILDITSRLYSKGFDIVFCWLPSHVGIIGNEQADSAAKSSTTHVPLAVPLSDMKRVIMHHIFKIWQESWSQQLDNKLHSVKPVIGAWPVMPMRRTDVKLTRLRIGHTRFTHRHLLFGERAPECPSCHVSYTVHHILIDCPVFNTHRMTFFHQSVLTLSDLASLYVDDLQISCEGSDMRMIERQLQTAVNNILKWCDTNGHSISASKSCCVHFCRKRGIHPDPEIRIRDIQIPVVPDVLSNTSWGADRTSLLRVYQAIVLSRIDYGCVAYGSACNSTLQKLDPVHHMALRICSGAFRTSPVQSLYINCHQLPLDLRRRKLSLAFYFKILSVPSHPLQNVYMSTSMKRLLSCTTV